ncbi:MAG: SGNH/GDSL hydrolase family protein [bacterium]|jgi:lysophospholipase L1-like esterase|nr:SGNH/GDSL hydrolase family protein [bacterium]
MKRITLITLMGLVLALTGVAGDDFLIQDGDRVVIWGDSITDNAFYPRSVENYVLSHYPDWTVEFHNLGWGGDRSVTLERMKRDLPQYKPTFVTIKLGMNDGMYTAFSQEHFDTYIKGYKQLLDFLKNHTEARIVLISTVPYETDVVPVRKIGEADVDMAVYTETLERFSAGVAQLAKDYGVGYIDLNADYAGALREGKAADPGFKLSGDAIHPDVNGQAYMAYSVLKGLNAGDAIAEVEIDAQAGTILAEQNAFLQNLKVEDNRITFTRNDRALPFRFSSEAQWNSQLTKKEQWYNDLNMDRLVVKNLPHPYASLAIDGQTLAVFSREALEQGINLSLLPDSPMLKQGAMIADMTEKRHQAEYTRWRRVLLNGVWSPHDFRPYHPETAEARYLQEVVCFYHQMQRKYNDPQPRFFTLTGGEKEALEATLKN